MAIEKNSFKVARFDLEFQSSQSRDTPMSSDDDEDFQRNPPALAVESDDDDDEFDDGDSGAGSDDYDILELGETGEEFCQVGDQTCSIPYELYDLPGLKDVLSMDAWNEVLTEDERFVLSKYLPDMDQEDFVCTMKELFSGDNLHFGNPIDKLFEMLKGGLCEPRVALYRKGLNFFQRRQHYHNLRTHHNSVVNNLCQIRDAWLNYTGYSIEEKLRVLNIIRSQKSLMNENIEEYGSESSDKEEWGKKLKDNQSRYSGNSLGAAADIFSRSRKTKTMIESTKLAKQNLNGTLKVAGSKTSSSKGLPDPLPFEMTSGHYGLGLPGSQYDRGSDYDSFAAVGKNEQILEGDDEAETMVEITVHRDRNFSGVGANNKPSTSKWKKHEDPRSDDVDSLIKIPVSSRNSLHSFGRNKTINKLSDIKVLTAKPPSARNMYDSGKKNLQLFSTDSRMKVGKGQKLNPFLKGSQIELLDANDPVWLGEHGSSMSNDMIVNNKKWKMSRQAIDLNVNEKLLHTEYRTKPLLASSMNGKRDGAGNRGTRDLSVHEDTETDSSEHIDADEDDNPLMRSKWAYPGGGPDHQYDLDMKKSEFLATMGSSHSSRRMDDYSQIGTMGSGNKGKTHDLGHFNILPTKENYFSGSVGHDDLRHQFYNLGRNGHTEGNHGNSSRMPSVRASLALGRRWKGELPLDFGLLQSDKFENDLFLSRPLAAVNGMPFKLGKKGQIVDLSSSHHPDRPDTSLTGCNSRSTKRKIKDNFTHMELQDNDQYLHAESELQLDGVISLRKRGKTKLEDVTDDLENGVSRPPVMEVEMEDVEAEVKQQKKSFPLITPTVHNEFSFSIMHLLSATRVAMTAVHPEDSPEVGKNLDNNGAELEVKEEQNSKQDDPNVVSSNSNMDVNVHVPSRTVVEIMNRVRSNPGDPCILETQEPLQDLVRGALKIFSSRTAPLGAKGWKPLVAYQKSSKSWSWIGPVAHNLSEFEEVTSPDAWGLPHKMLVKLVDSFANWLKNSQETLQQLGSLPPPPLTLNFDEKERFKDLRAQKSLNTISQSSDEVKAYFQKEEVLRYLIPDRAFSYTAVDGKKSIVAPLRRCGGKPTSKARDHFMLKRDRPPHVTILCLVRDAAARLPGSIGTRADVCTLIRDSQYIVDDVSDAQVNQVVSGALDRLHYERDPCVQFDGERKLWVYLHRDREEEDFEDDGTSSTKKWRRQKKEPSEGGNAGFDLVSDLNADNGNHQMEDNVETNHGSDHTKSAGEDGFVCQENLQ